MDLPQTVHLKIFHFKLKWIKALVRYQYGLLPVCDKPMTRTNKKCQEG